jgi:ubiquinone/menaquinone biosynthesis C-methylase UbiE
MKPSSSTSLCSSLRCGLVGWVATLALCTQVTTSLAQDKSVRPGINDSFKDPKLKVSEFTEKFEIESREVFAKREEILKACDIQTGSTLADIGSGTGLFTRLFAKAVGKDGNVIAVDISETFLEHIRNANRTLGIANVDTLLCTEDSTELPAESIDFAFVCDTYHHFEYPQKTLASVRNALKPNGLLVVIDFKRVEGLSSDWTMKHVRAGQEVFEAEIVAAGLEKVGEVTGILEENYMVVFRKPKP